MFLIILAVLVLAMATALKPVLIKEKLPLEILNQFLDYDLIVHFDNTTGRHIDFLAKKNHDHQAVYLINYDTNFEEVQRPKGYKYINIAYFQNFSLFQTFTSQPYSFFQYDFTLFITKENRGNQIWKMPGLQRASAVFLYNFKEEKMFHCCYYCGNATAILKEAQIFKMGSLLNCYSNFNGHVFTIAYANFPPFFWKEEGDEHPKGPEGKVLHEFSRVHNFRYKLIEYKSKPKKGAWQAMIEAVEQDLVDWAVGGLSMTLRRGTYTDFTRYIKNQGFAILYTVYQDTWAYFKSILLAFEWVVWFAIGFSIVAISFMAKQYGGGSFYKYARIALLAIADQVAPQSQVKLLNLSLIRAIFSIWWLTSLSLTTIYKSQLASHLIKPAYNQPNKVDDLVARNFQFYANKEDWSVLKDNLESSLDEVYSKILTRIEDDFEFCDSVRFLEGRHLAVIDEEFAMQYDIFKTCHSMISKDHQSNLRLVTDNIFPSTYHAWSMPMGTPFRLKFSKTIGRMDDYGLIAQW